MLTIRTEERPKVSTLKEVLNIYLSSFKNTSIHFNETDILSVSPIFRNKNFSFNYEVNICNRRIIDILGQETIPLKIVSGPSSFIDFLLFENDTLVAMIEETKTDDSESRNTAVYQRASKFVYANILFPNIKKFMLYTSQFDPRDKPSDTAIFGTRLLKTIGVNIVSRNIYYSSLLPFENIDDIISYKWNMRRPPACNTPVLVTKNNSWDTCLSMLPHGIFISGILSKPFLAGNIGHDPNIGCLTLISQAIRYLDFSRTLPIFITHHGVSQDYINRNSSNKFLYIASSLNVKLYGLNYEYEKYNYNTLRDNYFSDIVNSEKITTIFTHLILEHSKLGALIYENHAGCERGYFYSLNGIAITLPKRLHAQQLYIPDLIIRLNSGLVLNIEGKKLSTLSAGLSDILNYDLIENEYIKPNYGDNIQRWVTTYGGNIDNIPHSQVLIHINYNGQIILNPNAPPELREAINFFYNI
ncbi:MAG: hypothetical protein ACRC0S_09285 [Fusobacteriaceae bacterium]